MENENAIQNPVANQLPEAESLPDGFVGDSSSTDALAPKTPQPEQEKLSHEVIDYKEEKLVDPELNAYEDSENSKCRSAEANMGQDDQVRVKCHNLDNCMSLFSVSLY